MFRDVGIEVDAKLIMGALALVVLVGGLILAFIKKRREKAAAPQDAWADDEILAEGIARFEEFMEHSVERITSNWAGLRTFAPDRSLVIGPDNDNNQFFWLCGQGGYGFQTAAAASQLTSDLILNRKSELSKDVCRALSPRRFL